MKKGISAATHDKSKVLLANILFSTALIIMFLGMFFSIFSLVNHISFKILNSYISGAVFGLLVLYLGIRYYFSVIKLKEELYKPLSKFSWENFRRKKPEKTVHKNNE